MQIGEQTSGAGIDIGSTLRTQAEPGSQAMLLPLHLPCTQMLPDVSRPMPCAEPLTAAVHSVKTGDVQSALLPQTALSGRQTPSLPPAASMGESVVREQTSGAGHGSTSVGVAGTVQRVRHAPDAVQAPSQVVASLGSHSGTQIEPPSACADE